MANFQGNIVPAALQRLRRFFFSNPTVYSKHVPGTGMEEALAKADDIMDDGVINASGGDLASEIKIIPITGVGGTLDVAEFDIGTGSITSGTITPSVLPN